MTDSKPTPPKPSTSPGHPTNNTTLSTTSGTGIAKQSSGLKLPGLHARLRNPNVAAAADPLKKEQRLALMLDVSGSMDGEKIVALRDAVTGFITACDMSTTALAMETFGDGVNNRIALTCVQPMLLSTTMMLKAVGSTPMAQAMDYVINTYSITRGIIVSDGQPDSEQACYDKAIVYKEASIPVDTVHVGNSTYGEECLRKIAEMTGGQYIKFTDIQSFSKSFKYLTPAFYGILTSGGLSASELGAKEIK